MSRITPAACVIGFLVMSMATLRAGRAQEPLRIGDPLPALKGQLLTGRDVARDGRRFLVGRAVEDRAPGALTVTVNWPATLGNRN